jgi:hypothetical protein
VVIRWSRTTASSSAQAPIAEAPEHYRAQLQKELETFDR